MPVIDLELYRVLARPESKCERPTQGDVCKQRWGLSFSAFASVVTVWADATLVEIKQARADQQRR